MQTSVARFMRRRHDGRASSSGAARYDLYGHRAPRARAVEFHEEDALPRAQDKPTLVDRDHEIAPNHPSREVRPRIVVHTVVLILRLGQQVAHDNLEIPLETGLTFVDKYARGCM